MPLDAHGQVTEHQQDRTKGDGLARSKQLVCQQAADQRQHVNQRRVRAVLSLRGGVIKQEVLRHEEDQQAAHAVVGKALPHLGEEEDEETSGMSSRELPQNGYGRKKCDENARLPNDIHKSLPRV